MSSTRVVVGTDERGRPLSEWRTTPGDDGEPRYGFMERAHTSPIERRKATPDELAAARAREDEPSHLVAPTVASPGAIVQRAPDAEREAASRHRGGEVNRQRIAASQPPRTASERSPEEQPTVSEARTNIPETIPVPVEIEPPISTRQTEPVEATLAVLADAVGAAAEAWLAKLQSDHLADQANIAWLQARAALDASYRALNHSPADTEDLGNSQDLRVAAEPMRDGPVRSRSGEGQRPGQAAARDRRAAMVMAAMGRLGDDMGAVAAELGMKKNAVAQVVKHARLRAEAVQASDDIAEHA